MGWVTIASPDGKGAMEFPTNKDGSLSIATVAGVFNVDGVTALKYRFTNAYGGTIFRPVRMEDNKFYPSEQGWSYVTHYCVFASREAKPNTATGSSDLANIETDFVQVACSEDDKAKAIEIPTEEDGSLSIVTVAGIFDGVTSLKCYVNNRLRAVRIADNKFHPPKDRNHGELEVAYGTFVPPRVHDKNDNLVLHHFCEKRASASCGFEFESGRSISCMLVIIEMNWVTIASPDGSEVMQFPTEADGSLSMASVAGVFNVKGVTSLKYKDNGSNIFKAVRRVEHNNKFYPPEVYNPYGIASMAEYKWSSSTHYCVFASPDAKPRSMNSHTQSVKPITAADSLKDVANIKTDFVKVACSEDDKEKAIYIPTEEDGSLSVTTVAAAE